MGVIRQTLLIAAFTLLFMGFASAASTNKVMVWYDGEPGSGTSLTDASGHLTGTLTNTPSWQTTVPTGSVFNYVLNYTRTSSQYVTTASSGYTNIPGDLTIAAWVNPHGTTGEVIVSNYDGTGNFAQYQIKKAANNTLVYNVGNSGESSYYGPSLTVGTWQHIAITVSGNTLTWYKNGASAGTATIAARPTSGFGVMSIGRPGSYNGLYWNGAIGQVIIANETYTGTDISDLYASGAGILYNNFFSTASNATVTVTDAYTSSSLTNFTVTFNGVNHSTTNGTVILPVLTNTTSLWNLTYYSSENGGYFSESYTNINLSSTHTGSLYQFKIKAYDGINNQQLQTFNITQNGNTYTTTNGIINTNFDTYTKQLFNYTVRSEGFYQRNYENVNYTDINRYTGPGTIIDSFSRTNSSSWETADNGNTWTTNTNRAATYSTNGTHGSLSYVGSGNGQEDFWLDIDDDTRIISWTISDDYSFTDNSATRVFGIQNGTSGDVISYVIHGYNTFDTIYVVESGSYVNTNITRPTGEYTITTKLNFTTQKQEIYIDGLYAGEYNFTNPGHINDNLTLRGTQSGNAETYKLNIDNVCNGYGCVDETLNLYKTYINASSNTKSPNGSIIVNVSGTEHNLTITNGIYEGTLNEAYTNGTYNITSYSLSESIIPNTNYTINLWGINTITLEDKAEIRFYGDRSGTQFYPACTLDGTTWDSTGIYADIANGTTTTIACEAGDSYTEYEYNYTRSDSNWQFNASLEEFRVHLNFSANTTGYIIWETGQFPNITNESGWNSTSFEFIKATTEFPDGEKVSVYFNPLVNGTLSQTYEFYSDQDTLLYEDILIVNNLDSLIYIEVQNIGQEPLEDAKIQVAYYTNNSADSKVITHQFYTSTLSGQAKPGANLYYNANQNMWITVSKTGYETKTFAINSIDLTGTETLTIKLRPTNYANTYDWIISGPITHQNDTALVYDISYPENTNFWYSTNLTSDRSAIQTASGGGASITVYKSSGWYNNGENFTLQIYTYDSSTATFNLETTYNVTYNPIATRDFTENITGSNDKLIGGFLFFGIIIASILLGGLIKKDGMDTGYYVFGAGTLLLGILFPFMWPVAFITGLTLAGQLMAGTMLE